MIKMLISHDTFSQSVDKDTGELVTTVNSKSVTVSVKQDHFYMVYFEQLSSFYKLTSLKEVFILAKLCSMAQWNTGEVIISATTREEIMTEIGIDKAYLSRCITSLCSKELISRINTNHYLINPNCFWKGSSSSRNDLMRTKKLKLSIEFELAKD